MSRPSRCGSISTPRAGARFPFSRGRSTPTATPRAGAASTQGCATPAPETDVDVSRWRFRATECDIADHVNNAAYWQPLEEELLRREEQPEQLDVEIEFRAPAQPGEKQILRDGAHRWIVSADGETHASLAVHG